MTTDAEHGTAERVPVQANLPDGASSVDKAPTDAMVEPAIDDAVVKDSAFDEADEAMRLVLHSADIKRIVCVDDSYTSSGKVDTAAIIGAVEAGQLPGAVVRAVAVEFLGEDAGSYLADDGDSSAQAQWLRENADDLPDSTWARLGGEAPEGREGAITAQDPETLQLLGEFAAKVGIAFVGLNLPGWQTNGEEILREPGCTLILFDRNLSGDGGTEDQGERLLEATVQRYSEDKVVAVLFTHSISIEDEYSSWQDIANANPDYRDRVLVIAKQRLRADRADFASELKMAILAPHLRRVAMRVRDGFAQEAAAAAEQVMELSPHILHTILVTTVVKEGAWGPDGLAAIALTCLRRSVETYVRSDAGVREDAFKLRQMSLRSARVLLPKGAAEEYARINRDRLFDDAAHINELRLPIDTGDIFAFFDPEKSIEDQTPKELWIVVVQRCDLAVRSDGTRNYNPQLLPLARVTKVPEVADKYVGAAAIAKVSFAAPSALGYADCQINLLERRFVPAIALDACALNTDGVAKLVADGELPLEGLTPPWTALSVHHAKWVGKRIDRYRTLASDIPKKNGDLRRVVVASITGASKETSGFAAKVDLDRKAVFFGVRRVGRLREPYSLDLMERAGAISSRIPLEAAIEPDGG